MTSADSTDHRSAIGRAELPEGIRSWHLTIGTKEYWLDLADGLRIRELAAMNPSGFSYHFEFTALDQTLPVMIYITQDVPYTLAASGDD